MIALDVAIAVCLGGLWGVGLALVWRGLGDPGVRR